MCSYVSSTPIGSGSAPSSSGQNATSSNWKMDKLGGWVDPLDVARGASRGLHAVASGVSFTRSTGKQRLPLQRAVGEWTQQDSIAPLPYNAVKRLYCDCCCFLAGNSTREIVLRHCGRHGRTMGHSPSVSDAASPPAGFITRPVLLTLRQYLEHVRHGAPCPFAKLEATRA